MRTKRWVVIFIAFFLICLTAILVIARPRRAALAAQTPAGGATSAAQTTDKKIAYWWDPMLGPGSISNHPGKSAMGMDLVPVFENQAGAGAGAGVRIDPAVVQNMGVQTAPVEHGPLTLTVRAVGTLEVPDPAITDVTLRVGGYIEHLYADTPGMPVARGQVLLDLYSPEVQVAAQELIGAAASLKALGDGSSATNDVQRLVESARRKLQLWGIADQDIDAIAAADQPPRTVPIRSPGDGDVQDKSVVAGSSVQAGEKLMRIEDHRTLWLDAQVYEDQIEAVRVGQAVRADVDGLPGRSFTGAVSFIYPHLDHMTRTEIVRTELPNPRHELRPGMYASVEIVTQPATDAITVPREAVIDTGTKQLVFVADPSQVGHFEPRTVRPGLVGDDDRVQIVEGLASGEQVVTSGQFLMDVESRTTEAIEKLRGTAPSSPSAMTAATPVGSSSDLPATALAPPPTIASSDLLTVAHCPMKNADWLQVGEVIVNPYFGTMMPTCGSVVCRVHSPPPGTPLAAVVDAYLRVAAGLDADRLDTAAVQSLAESVDSADLRKAAAALASATSVADARPAFAAVGAALLPLLPAAP